MIHYKDFEHLILSTDPMNNKKWKHILPAIPIAHRYRFIKTHEKGFDLPTSYDMVMSSQTIGDKEYDVFLQQMIDKRDKGKVVKYKSAM